MRPDSLVVLNGVCRTYRTESIETRAVSDVSLRIEPGEFVSVSGPSGCGKSTLLGVIGLLDSPSAGEYWLNGRKTDGLDRHEAARVRNRELGFIFQSFNLIGDLSVAENVELPLCYRGCRAAEKKDRVHSALERVGLLHRASHYPEQLSGGEQQRVAVSRAIVGEPVLLLADEPTGNLDSKAGDSVMDILKDLHRAGTAIVMVTHDERYNAVADRTVHMLDGKLDAEPSTR